MSELSLNFDLSKLLLTQAADRMFQGGCAGLVQGAEAVMTLAKERTPVDTGNLRASGHVGSLERVGDTALVPLGFGGPAVGYARIVHEDLAARHIVGQAKYLETAVTELMPQVRVLIANGVRGAR